MVSILKITLIAVGKLKEKFWRDACAEYQKRLGGYAKFQLVELSDSTPEREESLILEALNKCGNDTAVILCDIKGTLISSEDLAGILEDYPLKGISHIVFVIGGSDGVTPRVRERAQKRISFGRITLPHNLARVVTLEQLYRACKILHHEPYHK